MTTIIRFGIDLAKNSFAICGVDQNDKIAVRETLKRHQLLEFFANCPPAVVAMEAGSGAHHWARELRKLGHDPRIIDPGLVAPYRHQGPAAKNDNNDAEAVCEAAGRPKMRFIPIKTVDQQAILVVHRLRTAAVAEHTRSINQMRGLLAEFGIVEPKGANAFKSRWPELRQQVDQLLPQLALQTLEALFQTILDRHQEILAFDRQIARFVRDDERAQRLTQINGIGPVTASALVATIGNGHDFKNGRQFAAWLGLTPRQFTTGGKVRLGRITRRGDVYLRTLLVHGARSELRLTPSREDRKSRWAEKLKLGKSWNKAAVALANKHARIAWAMLANNQSYHSH